MCASNNIELPPLNVDFAAIHNTLKRHVRHNDDTDINDDNKRTRRNSNDADSHFDLINAVHDDPDKNRGPRIVDDIYMRLDNVAADDLIVEKTMTIKWLIGRYKNARELCKPRDLMFAIIECVCTGLKLYLTTRQGDCCYLDHIEIYDGEIYCSTNEWILGFIGEKRIELNSTFDETYRCNYRSNDSDKKIDIDKIDVFGDSTENVVTDFVDSWRRLKLDDSKLPPLFCFFDDNVNYNVADRKNDTDKIIERERQIKKNKIETDMKNLKKSYVNLNVDMMAEKSPNCCVSYDDDVTNRASAKIENVLKLIVDMKELERLVVFLLYVDRESQYDDIDIDIKNKIGINRTFCAFKKTGLTNEVEERCLKSTNGSRLKTVYDNITNNQDSDKNNRVEKDSSKRNDNRENSCVTNVFECLTFLFFDKISTTIIESLFLHSTRAVDIRSYKFGVLDLIRPKISKSNFNKVDAKKVDIKRIGVDRKHRVGVLFDG